MDCVFCKIIEKAIPSEILYEDDHFVAFLDVNPVHPGHTLIVPKAHIEKFCDIRTDMCLPMAHLIQKVMKALTDAMGYEGINLIQNNGAAAGQVVPHMHFHIIPRKMGDGFAHWHGQAYTNGEAAIVAAQLREAIDSGA